MVFDLIVIGAGPGGYVAAIRAAQLGLKTAVFEKGAAGGVCLNLGCIPTKSLIKSADTACGLARAAEHGVGISGLTLDYAGAHARSRKIAANLSKGIHFLFKKNNVTLIQDTAELTAPDTVRAQSSGQDYRAKNIIIATGSKPKTLPGFEPDNARIFTSESLILRDKLPKLLIILGAGAIGVEFGYVFNAFGCGITLVELLDAVLPLEDRECGRALERELKKKKIRVLTSARAVSVQSGKSGVSLDVSRAGRTETLTAEALLLAVGRAPNTRGLGLEGPGVETDANGFIKVNEHCRTSVPSIYAIGDCVSTPLLAHVASHEGVHAVEHLAGQNPHPLDYGRVPSCTYTTPQVASFGLSEEKLREQGREYKKGVSNLKASGKAMTLGENSGFVKILSDPNTDRILGAHIVAPEAAELLHELLIAAAGNLPVGLVGRTMHAHPTLAESIMEAALAVDGRAIHQ